jgi:leucyl-tRNA synthetase
MKYDHRVIEKKWQQRWEKARVFEVKEGKRQDKSYALVMWPYPSAAGLHVGHPTSYFAVDIVARKRRMEGKDVLHPMGWDAFGLPAENYAIKTGVHPAKTTQEAIGNFRRQIKALGLSYDWSREQDSSSPEYYRWTQWLFLQLYRSGRAYKATAPVNWCPSCNTVLANEQAAGGVCDRCGTKVVQKELAQWFFKITDYAQELLTDIETLDWPEKIKAAQRNWIGKSEGVEIDFKGTHGGTEFDVPVFTTRPDTLFGVTYIVLAPEHPLVASLTSPKEKRAVEEYVKKTKGKSELERTGTDMEKTGVFLGAAAQHPLTGEPVPIWIADYVLPNYGTGAVMGVPAHDERDWEFARANGCEVNFVVAPPTGAPKQMGKAYTAEGVLAHSAEFNGLTSENARQKIADALESKKLGRRQTNWHLRDWLVSRQRYWGAPIPIIYCDECGTVPVPEKDLPVELPTDVDFKPTGESPLARSKSFQDVKCPDCGKKARRESDTMDTFVDSSWYFLRYADPHNDKKFADAKKIEHWCPVDLYVGGAEHAVLHLLYARFVSKALRDLKFLKFDEPFLTLRSQGLILGENGEKMSKSKGNVVNPDDVVESFGADALRCYEMFMGAFEDAKPWSTQGILGARRFLDRVYALAEKYDESSDAADVPAVTRVLHQTIKKVSADIEAFKFNTAISQMMIFVNEVEKHDAVNPELLETFVKILSPFAPHLSEELWEKMGNKKLITLEKWPTHDPKLAAEEEITLVVQINGKVRDTIVVASGTADAELEARALASDTVQTWLKGKHVMKIIVAKGKLVSIVTD